MTPKERAAMQQALEYLKGTKTVFTEDEELDEAITALREALEQPVSREPVAWVTAKESFCGFPKLVFSETHKAGYKPLYTAPQPVSQEPFGYVSQHVIEWLSSDERSNTAYSSVNIYKKPCGSSDMPIYTAPQPAKEVELTDDEIAKACGWEFGQPMYEWVIGLARAVIAAYKEKQK